MNDLSSVVTGCAPCAPADVNSALCSPQRPRSVSTSDWASCLGEWNMRGSQHGWWEQQTQVGHGGPCPGNGGRGYQNHLILFVFRISESGWDLDFATNIHQHENELSWECVVCSGRNHGMASFFRVFPQKNTKIGGCFWVSLVAHCWLLLVSSFWGDATILSVPPGGYMRLPLDFSAPRFSFASVFGVLNSWLFHVETTLQLTSCLTCCNKGEARCYCHSIYTGGGVTQAAMTELRKVEQVVVWIMQLLGCAAVKWKELLWCYLVLMTGYESRLDDLCSGVGASWDFRTKKH